MPRVIDEPKRLRNCYELVVDLEGLTLVVFSHQYFDRLMAFFSEPAMSNAKDFLRLLQMVQDHLTFGGTIYGRIGTAKGSDINVSASPDGNTLTFRFIPFPNTDLSKLDLISRNRALARQYGTAKRFAEHLLSYHPVS